MDEGKIPNMFECIICDPGERKREAIALGLFYTATSRATTLGDEDGLNSAIYFEGKDFVESRFRNIGQCLKKDASYKLVKKRSKWVSFLEKHKHGSTMSSEDQESVLDWASNTRITFDALYSRVSIYTESTLSHRSHQVTASLSPTTKNARKRSHAYADFVQTRPNRFRKFQHL